MFCTQCGARNEDGAKFCTSCGAPMEGAAPEDAAQTGSVPNGSGAGSQQEVSPAAESTSGAAQQQAADQPGQAAQPGVAVPPPPGVGTSSGFGQQAAPGSAPPYTQQPQPAQQPAPGPTSPIEVPKKRGAGRVVAIAVAALAVVAIAVVGTLAVTGNLPFGQAGGTASGSTGSSAGEPAAPAETDILTVEFYEQSYGDVLAALEEQGFTVVDGSMYVYSSSVGDEGSELFVSFSSDDAGQGVIGNATGEMIVSLVVADSDWTSEEAPTSPDEISSEAVIGSFVVAVRADIAEDEYASAMLELCEVFGYGPDITRGFATNPDLGQSLLDTFDESSDMTLEDVYEERYASDSAYASVSGSTAGQSWRMTSYYDALADGGVIEFTMWLG